MTKEDIEAAKRAAFAAKPHIEVNAKKLRKKDYRDEIDTIIKAGEEDYQDFSDDELSQVLKVKIVIYIHFPEFLNNFNFNLIRQKIRDVDRLRF